jgi:hypothetical protein
MQIMFLRDDQLRAYRIGAVANGLKDHNARESLDAIVSQLTQANDHVGAAFIGAKVADALENADGRSHLLQFFNLGDNALAVAALNLGTISVKSALDLCAAAILIASGRDIRKHDEHEYAMHDLISYEKRSGLSEPFQYWLKMTNNDDYKDLKRWRDPQTHRVVQKGYSATEPTSDFSGVSVQVYGVDEQALGAVSNTVRRFAEFGETRFLAACYALQQTAEQAA